MEYPTVTSLFVDRVSRYANTEQRNVFYFRSNDRWQGISWRRFEEETYDFATALLSFNLEPRGSVCILMGNVPEWPISDIGTIMAGGVGVGLYPTSSAEQIAYIINHSDAEFVLVDTREQLQKVLSVRDQLPKVRHIIALDTDSANDVIAYGDFIARGREERQQCARHTERAATRLKPGQYPRQSIESAGIHAAPLHHSAIRLANAWTAGHIAAGTTGEPVITG